MLHERFKLNKHFQCYIAFKHPIGFIRFIRKIAKKDNLVNIHRH
jgi:hypothetical protein